MRGREKGPKKRNIKAGKKERKGRKTGLKVLTP